MTKEIALLMLYWSAKNSATGEMREQLTDAELVNFLSALEPVELTRWLACRSDRPEWFSCAEIPAFKLRKFGLPPIPNELAMSSAQIAWLEKYLTVALDPSAGQVRSLGQARPVTPSDGERRGAGVDRRSWADRRQYPRKNIKLQVVLISDKHAFRTFTKNISMGGMALERAIPEHLIGAECTIFLSEPNSTNKFVFTGSVLTESDRPGAARSRIAFGQVASASLEALGKWIEASGESADRAA
ncbi:MAG: PilZ domain-containing protein [Oligoflexia bacterium]